MKEEHRSENVSSEILQDIAPYAEILEQMWEEAGIENDYLFAVVMGDGADKIFLNTKGTEGVVPADLQNVLDLINGQAPADEYCQKVADRVDDAKHSVEVKRMYLNVNIKQMAERYEAEQEGLAKGHAKGLEEGLTKGHEDGLRILCGLVTSGKLSATDAAASASAYGVTDEADLRARAQALGIQL